MIWSWTWTPETIKLQGTTKIRITKHKNGDKVPRLEITEVALIHCNVVNNSYQQNLRVLYTFVPKILWSIIKYFTLIFFIFKNIWFEIFTYWCMV